MTSLLAIYGNSCFSYILVFEYLMGKKCFLMVVLCFSEEYEHVFRHLSSLCFIFCEYAYNL